MKLTFLLSSLQLSGGVHVVLEFANRLQARGHSVRLVYPDSKQTPTPRIPIAPAIEQIVVAAGPEGGLQTIRLLFGLARAVPPSDFIISTHTPTTAATLLASRLRGQGKGVWLFQDYIEMFTHRPLSRWLLKNGLRWHRCGLAISHSALRELSSYAPGQVVFVGEGLSDASLFLAEENPLIEKWPPPEAPFTIMSLLDDRPRKGFEDFLQAIALLQPSFPNVHLLLYGKTAVPFDTALPHTVVLNPSRAELAALYRQSHLFVLASWYESFGLPPLEAMACGTPVVMTNSVGVTEYGIDGENCLLVPPRDPQALAEGMGRVLGSASLAQKLADAGRKTALAFDWESAVSRFEKALIRLRDEASDTF